MFCSELNALKILELHSTAYCFPNYQIIANCLKDVGYFGQYKFPCICPFFAFAPLDVPNLLLPVQTPQHYRSRAEIACLILATIRRGDFHFVIGGKIPSDYLTLPNTPFANSSKKRKPLTRFHISLGEINRPYQKLYSFHHFEELIDNPDTINHIL